MKQFYGKKVLVTGAASGIGRLMALAFAGRGADIIVVDLNVAGAEKVVKEIHDIGRQAWAYGVDISSIESIRSLRQQVKTDIGKIIGKEGKTAKAIRTILLGAATKLRRRTVLEIVE